MARGSNHTRDDSFFDRASTTSTRQSSPFPEDPTRTNSIASLDPSSDRIVSTSSEMSADTASIYVTRRDGVVELISDRLTKTRLCRFSKHADHYYQIGPVRKKACTGPNPFLVAEPRHLDADIVPSINIIVDWIKNYDFANPTPLSTEHISCAPSSGGPTLKQAVDLQYTCQIFSLDRHLRGEVLRQQIRDYADQSPLTLNEFQMIVEVLAADKGLVKDVMAKVNWMRLNGREVPEWDAILTYCGNVDLWEEMDAIAVKIAHKLKKDREREAAGEAAQRSWQ